MTPENLRITIGIICFFMLLMCSIGARFYHQRRLEKARVHCYTPNIITSQTRPLIIYHVPISSMQETPPPSYDRVVNNLN
jgi:hypothetical protein